MRYFLAGFALIIIAVIAVAGFRGGTSRKPPLWVFPDMDNQLKLLPQKESGFFSDGRSSRLPVANTIARGARYEDIPVNTGLISGTTNWVASIPVPVTAQLMARGEERYGISCLPCHGPQGDGNGITRQYGMAIIGSLHDPRMVRMNDGEMFHVITHGRNLMGAYAANIEVDDRWAIVAYVRALQRSRLADLDDVPEAMRSTLQK